MSDGATGGSAPSAPTTTATAASAPATTTAKPSAPQAANDNGALQTTTAKPQPSNDNATPEAKHRIKVRGEEKELGLSEILKLAEKAEGAETRFREAAKLEREINTVLERLQQDPIGGLEALMGDRSRAGKVVRERLLSDPDLRAELERDLLALYEYEGKSPDERKRVDEERDLRRKAAELEQIQRREAQQRQAQLSQQYQQQFDQAFSQALTAVGAKVNRANIRAMVAQVEPLVMSGRRITREQLMQFAQAAKAEYEADHAPSIEGLDGAALAALLGEKGLATLRAYELERLKPKAPEVQRTNGKGKAPPERDDSGRFTSKPKVVGQDFWRRVRGEST